MRRWNFHSPILYRKRLVGCDFRIPARSPILRDAVPAERTVAALGAHWVRQCVLPMVLFAMAAAAHAEDYTVAVEAIDYMPLYSGIDPLAYRGFARDLLDLFARKHGHRFSYSPLPLNRLYKEVFVARQYDFKFPDNPSWQPEIKTGVRVSYSDPVAALTEGVFVPANKVGKGLQSIKSIATITGFTPTPYLPLVQAGKIKLYSVDSLESLVKMGLIDRVDGIYLNTLAIRYLQEKQAATDNPLTLDKSLPTTTIGFTLSSIKQAAVIQQFNRFLQTDRVEIAALKNKYKMNATDF